MKRVMLIGSGPIVIGQAAEFDYAGSQACKSLREEGLEVILVNSNPATIMTDTEMADRVYIEPLTVESCERIIARERPEGLIATLGGQTGLNLAASLAAEGVLDAYNVRLLGTPLEAIHKAEDREKFRELMREIREPVPESWIVTSESELEQLLDHVSYPCIIRPAYTLGGTGGGVAHHRDELWEIGCRGLSLSLCHQVLVERSLLGWKELEYEVMRDSMDNCITICNMENLDPMGVHTGDSIVVAPSQTLSDIEYHILRTASLHIIRALKVEGGCNVQFAVNPHSFDYYVIEVNPRVSRSSALASKATGYPIARVSAKIAIGKTLDQIENAVTKTTKACFEPALDYCVVKIPRWPFDKFTLGDRRLTTQMKSTGEVMAIDRRFEDALLKAIRGLEVEQKDLNHEGFKLLNDAEIELAISTPTDDRLWAVAEALRRGFSIEKVNALSHIDPWFLVAIQKIVFSNVTPTPKSYKMVDTCAGEFESRTPYYYASTDEESDLVELDHRDTVLVLGSGPIRIGQGIEFDYSCVHCAWALEEMGIRAVILNNNPETVSTDFDTAGALYFDPVTAEEAARIAKRENTLGVMVQFGGQTAINLAKELSERGIRILGTSVDAIERAEDRKQFDKMLTKLKIPRPLGAGVVSVEEALAVARDVGYPLLVRPSYVLGGRAMEIVWNDEELSTFIKLAAKVSRDAPVLVDQYLRDVEAEIDAISDGEDTLVVGIMEHIERAGVHSGDSMAVYPPVNITKELQIQMAHITQEIAKELGVCGLLNIQFVLHKGTAYVLEVNPRASRTVPFLSKAAGIPMVQIATRCAMGDSLSTQGLGSGIWHPLLQKSVSIGECESTETIPQPNWFAVKAPVFSFQKLTRVEPTLGPEMKSTGEAMGIDYRYEAALYKAMVASNLVIKQKGKVIITVADRDKKEAIWIAEQLIELGFEIMATQGTQQVLKASGISSQTIAKLHQDPNNILTHVNSGDVVLLINTPSDHRETEQEALPIRRACVEMGIPCLTSIDTAKALVSALRDRKNSDTVTSQSVSDYFERVAIK